MTHRRLAGVLSVGLAALSGSFSSPVESSAGVPEPVAIRTLVENLAMVAGTTNAVSLRDAVLNVGADALPALRDIMAQTNRLSFQTLGLLRALAAECGGQKDGAVVRGTANEVTRSGLMDGDVVIREDNTPVFAESDMGLSRTLRRGPDSRLGTGTNEVWRLLVRRPDGTDVATEVTFDREAAPRFVYPIGGETIVTLDRTFPFHFVSFPDSAHRYRVRGAIGPWDGIVVEAMWRSDIGHYARSRELLEEAFAHGCRDPLAFAVWVEDLNASGGFDAVPFLCASYERHLVRTKETQTCLLGRIQVAKSHSQFLLGQTELAFKLADDGISRARADGATNSLGILLPWRIRLGVAQDPEVCWTYARTNREDLRQFLDPASPHGATALRYAVRRLNAIGHDEMAREILGLFDPQSVRKIQSELDRQRRLATQYSNETTGVCWMPVKAAMALSTQEPPPGSHPGFSPYREVPYLGLRGPFRLDWTVGILSPGAKPDFERAARVFGIGTEGAFSVDLSRDGSVLMELENRYNGTSFVESSMVGDPARRRRLSLRLTSHSLRLDIDGQPHILEYFDRQVDPLVAASDAFAKEFAAFGDVAEESNRRILPKFVSVCHTGTFERIVAYTPSTGKVDAEAVASTLLNLERAISENHLTVATQIWQTLQVSYQSVAEANSMLRDARNRMAAFTGTTDKAWVPLTEISGRGFFVEDGLWKREGEWLTLCNTNGASDIGRIMNFLRAGDTEIAGLLDIPHEATNATCRIHWFSRWSKYDNAFHIMPGKGLCDFGVWQDPRLFLRNRRFSSPSGPIPFLIRTRGTSAALFVGSGDKPLVVANDLRNHGTFIYIDIRNVGSLRCRIGGLRVRPFPMGKTLDAPAEMPTVKEEKK